ncbi:hypothetical protein H9P43_000960 [Blastocladiella emersonii ATCC 22665]|nr:hypothetical protein H9P43_000960 [Blastocladiella emersonii ATCC 22665]
MPNLFKNTKMNAASSPDLSSCTLHTFHSSTSTAAIPQPLARPPTLLARAFRWAKSRRSLPSTPLDVSLDSSANSNTTVSTSQPSSTLQQPGLLRVDATSADMSSGQTLASSAPSLDGSGGANKLRGWKSMRLRASAQSGLSLSQSFPSRALATKRKVTDEEKQQQSCSA